MELLAGFVGQPVVALEIGCWEGRTTVWLLENILTHPQARIICIDPFAPYPEAEDFDYPMEDILRRFRANIALYSHKVTFCKARSDEVLPLSIEVDIAYIDGSHEARDVFKDASRVWKMLTPGGVMILDDYGWATYSDPIRTPKAGVDEFMRRHVGEYNVLDKGYQVALEKCR